MKAMKPDEADLADVAHASSRSRNAAEAFLTSRVRLLRVFMVVCGFAGIAAAIVAADAVFNARTASVVATAGWYPPVSSNPLGACPEAFAAKLASTLLTLMLLACVVAKARYRFVLLGLRRQLLPGQRFWETPLLVPTVVEFLICAVCCPVGVYALVDVVNAGKVVVTYDLDSLLSALMFLRLGLLAVVIIREASGFDSYEARVVERSTSQRFNASFAARQILDKRPISATLVAYFCVIGVLTYAMRVAEGPVCVTPEAIYVGWCTPTANGEPYFRNLRDGWNAAWLVIITSLTVGYGDLFPYTQLGRLVSVIAAFAGIILIALLVTAVSNASKFTFDEERALFELRKRSLMAEHKRLASCVVGAAVLFAADRRKRSVVAAQVRMEPLAAVSAPIDGGSVTAGATLPFASRRRTALAPPSRGVVARLARALRTWTIANDAWIAACGIKDTASAMSLDVHAVRDALTGMNVDVQAMRSALASVNAKLDALAAGKGPAPDAAPPR